MAWSNTKAYGIGDRVYVESYGAETVGATFVATASSTGKEPYTNAEFWEEVGFPELMRDYVVEAVTAEEKENDEERWRGRAAGRAILEELHGSAVVAQTEDRVAVELGR